MSQRRRERTLQRLEDFPAAEPAILMFRDGNTKIAHVYDIDQDLQGNHSLIYSVGGLPHAEGSKVDPRDWLPSVPLHELGYVQVQSTGRKVSLMPFQRQVA